jgi:allantoicase
MAHKGIIEKVLIDTCHFKGNYPDSCMLEGCHLATENEDKIRSNEITWKTILTQVKLGADQEHFFEEELVSKDVFSHVRLSIFPDGGISRMRLWGRIQKS